MPVAMIVDALDRCSIEPDASFRSGIIVFIARNRWFWIPPLYVLALLIVIVVTHTHGTVPAQFMYRNF